MRHVLSALVQNVPGVLAHVSGMLASRGYNITSLAVGETEDPKLSRMTFVVSGDDSLTLPLMAAGADGVISVVANQAPGLMSSLVAALLEGDLDRARGLHFRLLPLMLANFVETNPVPVKLALELMGRMQARYRLPLVAAQPESESVVRNALIEAGLLEEAARG